MTAKNLSHLAATSWIGAARKTSVCSRSQPAETESIAVFSHAR
jgi:hypothetical protein